MDIFIPIIAGLATGLAVGFFLGMRVAPYLLNLDAETIAITLAAWQDEPIGPTHYAEAHDIIKQLKRRA